MRISPHALLASLTACLSLGLGTHAANAQQRMVQVQFITFPQTQEPLALELVVSETDTVKLEIPSNELSQTYRVPRLSTMVFGETGVDAEGKPKFDVYGQGRMAAGNTQTVLILRKGKEFKQGFELRAISSDPEEFAGGRFLFLNATSKPIAGFAGHQNRFGLKPGHHAILTPNLEKDGRRAYMEFYYMTQNEQGETQSVPFFNSFWPVDNSSRGFVFFYQDSARENKITFHSYRDFIFTETEP